MTLQRTTVSDELARSRSRFVTETLDISLSDENTYRLDSTIGTIGFVRRHGNSFLALLGASEEDAFDVGESLSFDSCVAMVVTAYRQ